MAQVAQNKLDGAEVVCCSKCEVLNDVSIPITLEMYQESMEGVTLELEVMYTYMYQDEVRI